MPADLETLQGSITQERVASNDELCAAVSTGGPFQLFTLPKRGDVTIGRSRDNDVRIEDPSVSRHHAVLRVADDALSIKDLSSSNGVRVHDEKIASNVAVPITVGQFVKVGAAVFVVRPRTSGARPRWIWEHSYFEGRVDEEVARCERTGASFAVVRISLPRSVSTGQAEEAFAAWLRTSDVLARYAPGEYEVLFVELEPREAETAVQRLADELVHQLGVAAGEVRTGIACYPRDQVTSHELFARANAQVRGGSVDRPAVSSPTPWPPQMRTEMERIAASNASVLILGETGVGKEVAAETIHRLSRRAGKRLLRLNCAALTETLLESELFGYEKGAFTGANKSKPGLFETADGGTVFLDEIGDLPLNIQVKLLRVLEDRKVQRVGALEPRSIDVRFLAATNRDVEAQVASGRFRQDLYFRLNTFTLGIAPLRERLGEVPELARLFAESAATDNDMDRVPSISSGAMHELTHYSWPGNVRELRNVIERAVVLSDGQPIVPDHLPLQKMRAAVMAPRNLARVQSETSMDEAVPTGRFAPIPRQAAEEFDQQAAVTQAPAENSEQALEQQLRDLERQRIVKALDEAAGNQTQAARALGISRGTLIKRLDQYDIPRPRKGR